MTRLISDDLLYYADSFRINPAPANLLPEESEALRQLIGNKSIVIKPADKGSAVVIMDRSQYIWEGHRQLHDARYYSKLEAPIYTETVPMIFELIHSLWRKKYITHKQRDYLLGDAQPRPRLFYMLPKIHKEPVAWSEPFKIPPGRPIVSDCSSETYHTAEFLDHYLYPLSISHASYVKDTYDFVSKVRALRIPTHAFLFTMDVDSLYTNIDIAGGMRAVRNAFNLNPDVTRPDDELLRLLEINLTRNDFLFDDQFFLQVKGTAMGKKFAPSYANLFMAQWETSALAACPLQPLSYMRYLDDIWGVWQHSESEFQLFLEILNTHDPSITLKSCQHLSSVDFLDTTTFKGPDFAMSLTLDVKVYFKPTDTHALLHANSFHPKHTFAGLLKSQLLRFQRICSRTSDFWAAVKILFQALSLRGYSRSARRLSLKEFKLVRPPVEGQRIPLVTTYSTSSSRLTRCVRNNFQCLLDSTTYLPGYNIIAAYRRNKNIRDLLIRAKLRPLVEPKVDRRSYFYNFVPWAHNKNNGDVFPTDRHSDINTKNCVYLIRCLACDLQYVGETGNTIRVRFHQHKHNIKRKKDAHLPLVAHFVEHGWLALSASVLEANPFWSAAQRRRAERLWIDRLGTWQPLGLNVGVGGGPPGGRLMMARASDTTAFGGVVVNC